MLSALLLIGAVVAAGLAVMAFQMDTEAEAHDHFRRVEFRHV